MPEAFTNPFTIVILGFFIGFIATIVGLGGGFILVPYLVLVHGFSPQKADGTSLSIILLNVLFASIFNIKEGRIDYKLGINLSIFAIPGAILGTFVIQLVRVRLFQILFGTLLLATVIYIFFAQRFKEKGKVYKINYKVLIVMAFLGGFAASMFGIGGGIIHVPVMGLIFKVPAYIATGTSQFIAVWTSLTASILYLARLQVELNLVFLFAPGIIIGARMGVFAAKKVNSNLIRKTFCIVVSIVAIRMILKGLW
jgi:hypothetical protein